MTIMTARAARKPGGERDESEDVAEWGEGQQDARRTTLRQGVGCCSPRPRASSTMTTSSERITTPAVSDRLLTVAGPGRR
jgi:hypothetical protein